MSRRIVTQKLAAKLWEKAINIVTVDDTVQILYSEDRDAWDAFVTEINTSLNPLDLEFAHVHDQETGQELYAMVNRKGDEIAQVASEYSVVEIAYFKAVVEQIMLAPHESYAVSSLAALREVNTLKQSKLTKSQAELVLTSFVARGWLNKSKRGRYTLASRTLLELQSYLKSTYPDEVIECTICFEMVTHGTGCNTPQCKARLHQHCYNVYRRRNNACPTCKTVWGNDKAKVLAIGEAAFQDGQDKLRRQMRRPTSEEDSDEEDAEPEGTQSQPSQTQQNGTQANAKGKGKGKKKAVREESMEVDEDDDEAEASPTQTQKRRSSRLQ